MSRFPWVGPSFMRSVGFKGATKKDIGSCAGVVCRETRRPQIRPLLVIGVFTTFGGKKKRNAVRKAWMGIARITGTVWIGKLMPKIGCPRSSFLLVFWDDVVEALDGTLKKAKLFFAHVKEKWEAEFYSNAKDDVYVNNIGVINGMSRTGGNLVTKRCELFSGALSVARSIIGYFRHSSGEIGISWALAKFISINRSILRSYAHDNVSAGSWFIGLYVMHIDEKKFCCSSWPSGAICSGM